MCVFVIVYGSFPDETIKFHDVFPRFNIVKSCWESKAEDRPHFSQLVTELVQFLSLIADYFDLHDVVIGNPATEEECMLVVFSE